jgi:integrase
MAINQKLSTRQLLEKIPNFPCLYRHKLNGCYYGIKKVSGKRKDHSLQTTDRKIAERKLAAWVKSLDKIDSTAEKTTLNQLIEKFLAGRHGKSDSTTATEASIVNLLKSEWRHGLDIRISQIRPSFLDEWLAKQEGRVKNTTYNRYCSFLKQLFEIAVADRMVIESPFLGVKTKWKAPQKPRRLVPTQEQFNSIINDVRNQRYNAEAKDSADFIEFLGLAGLGQAEASSLTWGDVDWSRNVLHIKRHKTQARFQVPIYEWLKPLLEKLLKDYPTSPSPSTNIFKIKDAKKALAAACKRFGFHQFTQRNIRASLIRRLWQAGVDVKLISKWQGHQDGGRLILNTYTEVFGADDAEYIKSELAKVK